MNTSGNGAEAGMIYWRRKGKIPEEMIPGSDQDRTVPGDGVEQTELFM